MADQLIVLAQQSLVGDQQPSREQMVRAGTLLDLALGLNPRDTEAWRLSIELANRAGDLEKESQTLRRYCVLEPTDDAAQLAWTLSAIRSSGQTLEQRIAAAERTLDGQAAAQLSQAMRSRIASTVGRWAIEVGDAVKAQARLKEALILDSSNKEAARLMVELLVRDRALLEQIGQAVLNLVEADPLDVFSRRLLAQLLSSQSAFLSAAQQYRVAQLFSPTTHDDQMVYQWVLSAAAGGRPDEALNILTQYEKSLQPPEALAPSASGEPNAPPATPVVSLPTDLSILQLAILQGSDITDSTRAMYKLIQARLRHQSAAGDAQSQEDLIWLGLLLGEEKPDAPLLARGKTGRLENDPYAARLVGWIYLRDGNVEAARRAFGYIPQDPFAAYGMAMTYHQADDPQRLGQLQKVIELGSHDLAALLAARELLKVGVFPQPTEVGRKLSQSLGRWPSAMLEPNQFEDKWVTLSLAVDPGRYRYLQPMSAMLRLRNMAEFPLAVGPDVPIPSQLLIDLSLRQAQGAAVRVPPMVVDMRRRLSLKPRETMEVVVRLDRSVIGPLLVLNPVRPLTFDATAVLDPQLSSDGHILPGVRGAMDRKYMIERFGSLVTAETVDQRITMLKNANPIEQMEGMAWLMGAVSILDQARDSAEAKQLGDKLAEAVNGWFAQTDAVGQAWGVRFLPPGAAGRTMFEPIHGSAQRSADPMVKIVYAATQIDDPQSAMINSMLRDNDLRVVSFAQAMRAELEIRSKAKTEPAP